MHKPHVITVDDLKRWRRHEWRGLADAITADGRDKVVMVALGRPEWLVKRTELALPVRWEILYQGSDNEAAVKAYNEAG